MSDRLLAAVDVIEGVICERYNVKSISGLGVLAEAVAQARVGNVELLTEAMAGREMYRWRETADAALAEVLDAAELNEATGETKPLARMTKAELLARASELGIDIAEGATNDEIRALLTPEE